MPASQTQRNPEVKVGPEYNSRLGGILDKLYWTLEFEGKGYSMANYRPLAAMFKNPFPMKSVWKTGRQCGKSMTIAAFGLLLAVSIPDFHVLYAQPLHNQAKMFSRDRMDAIIRDSRVVKELLRGPHTVDNWERKILSTRSSIRISYILKNVMRIRGASADFLNVDEYQDSYDDILTIIEACLTNSEYDVQQYTGTPNTTTNILQESWLQSSMGEWEIPCRNGHWNRPAWDADLEEMIKGESGPICATCGASIDPLHPKARWVHAFPDKRFQFAGYHVPQILLPVHYRKKNKWLTFQDRMENWPEARFLNECLGEACDVGYKRLSPADLMAAGQLDIPDEEAAFELSGDYDLIVVGGDWGGKGYVEGTSLTAYAVMGKHKYDPFFDLIWWKVFPRTAGIPEEISYLDWIFGKFNAQRFAWDANVDESREHVLLRETSIPQDKLMPIYYQYRPRKDLIEYTAPDKNKPRGHYLVDRTRSLLTMFSAIKNGYVRLPLWEQFDGNTTSRALLAFEDNWSMRQGIERLYLQREAEQSDDLGHAMNYALSALLYKTEAFTEVVGSTNPIMQELLDSAD